MRTSSLIAAAIGLSLVTTGAALALDAAPRPTPLAPNTKYSSVRDALRDGVRDYNAGDKRGAVQALEYAAGQGHSLALWKLGRMYADGDGVPHDDLKAFEFFSKLADQNADEPRDSPNASVVASAFVALGTYFLDGINKSYVIANPVRAAELFTYAALWFNDPNAQFNLARLYMDGNGVEKDARTAARWFNLAAEKGHHASQAMLGRLLFNEQVLGRQRARGLMWLTLARESADSVKDRWIVELYDSTFAASSDNDRRLALSMLEQYMQTRR
jgi:TPR repeat protein